MEGEIEARGVRAHEGEGAKKPPTLTLWPLVALIFFDTCGGPFGTEDAVGAAGPLLVIVGFLVLPLVWSLPEALLVAELSTAFPEDTGYVAWVSAAFGPFWGFQKGWFMWLAGALSLTSYPVLFVSYLDQVVPEVFVGWRRIVLCIAFVLVLAFLNYRGLHIVGFMTVLLAVLILLPFLLLIGFCLPHIRPANWGHVDFPNVDWVSFLNIMFWNLNYWEVISTLAGEVAEPAKTFPRALGIALVLVVSTYLLPTAAALGVYGGVSDDWELGFFATIANKVAGPWLQWWVLSAAFLMAVGMFESLMSANSFQLLGMAHRGFLPAVLGHRSRYGTPTLGILLSTIPVIALVPFDFIDLIAMQNIVFILGLLMAFASFVSLRFDAPHLHRPYRVPVSKWGAVMMLVPATCLHMILLILPFVQQKFKIVGWLICSTAAGALLYPFLLFVREQGWLRFTGEGPHRYDATVHGRSPYNHESSRADLMENSAKSDLEASSSGLDLRSSSSGLDHEKLGDVGLGDVRS